MRSRGVVLLLVKMGSTNVGTAFLPLRAAGHTVLVRPDLIELLWYNGSRLAILLNGIDVSEAQAITK